MNRLSEIVQELASIEILKEEIKSRSMMYQADQKEATAIRHGLHLDAYNDLTYYEWSQIRDKE